MKYYTQCPASMCPLIAPNGSPWTGSKNAKCPEHDDIDNMGCPWFSMTCSTGGIHSQVLDAEKNNGKFFVVGPNQPRDGIGQSKTFDCAKQDICSWNKYSKINGFDLCPPRFALSKGLDPRVCLF